MNCLKDMSDFHIMIRERRLKFEEKKAKKAKGESDSGDDGSMRIELKLIKSDSEEYTDDIKDFTQGVEGIPGPNNGQEHVQQIFCEV